jgi:hypothetical protein
MLEEEMLAFPARVALIWLKIPKYFEAEALAVMPRGDCTSALARRSGISTYLLNETVKKHAKSVSVWLT